MGGTWLQEHEITTSFWKCPFRPAAISLSKMLPITLLEAQIFVKAHFMQTRVYTVCSRMCVTPHGGCHHKSCAETRERMPHRVLAPRPERNFSMLKQSILSCLKHSRRKNDENWMNLSTRWSNFDLYRLPSPLSAGGPHSLTRTPSLCLHCGQKYEWNSCNSCGWGKKCVTFNFFSPLK